MEGKPIDPLSAPGALTRIAAWYGTVWIAGVIAGFLFPNTNNFQYEVGAMSWDSPISSASSVIILLGESLVAPIVLLQGFIFAFGNLFHASGLFLLIIVLVGPIAFISHLIYFLRIKERGPWLILWGALLVLCVACIIGCSMNIGPNLIPGWT